MTNEQKDRLKKVAPFLNENEIERIGNLAENGEALVAELDNILQTHLKDWSERCVIDTPEEAVNIGLEIMRIMN